MEFLEELKLHTNALVIHTMNRISASLRAVPLCFQHHYRKIRIHSSSISKIMCNQPKGVRWSDGSVERDGRTAKACAWPARFADWLRAAYPQALPPRHTAGTALSHRYSGSEQAAFGAGFYLPPKAAWAPPPNPNVTRRPTA